MQIKLIAETHVNTPRMLNTCTTGAGSVCCLFEGGPSHVLTSLLTVVTENSWFLVIKLSFSCYITVMCVGGRFVNVLTSVKQAYL